MNVTLELIDEATGAVLAESESPIDALPHRFAGMDTRLTVGDADYDVTRAEPDTREAIAAAGKARLTLRRVVAVDPKSVLFSLPTIEDAVPACEGAPDEAALRFAPDDYRQVEFVHASRRAEVDAELADVRRIKAEHRRGAGFDAIHVRKRVPAPLGLARLTRKDIEAALGAKARPYGLRGERGVVPGGFAIPDVDAAVYGVERDGALVALCVHGIAADVIGKLHATALAHDLMLVDWPAAQCLRAHELGFVT